MTSFAFILGVVPLVLANGAGAEMRRSLGTAVFSGMLGVTLFGIFLTPVFFYVIQGLGERNLLSGRAARWGFSLLFGGLAGAAAGFLLGQVRVSVPEWLPGAGAAAGLFFTALILGRMHRRGGGDRP
jgi:multidrug efflux pump